MPIRFLLAATLLLGTTPAYASFSDVPSNHPNADAIAYVQAQGIVSGYPDGTFRPDAKINRAEFVKIIVLSRYADMEALTTIMDSDVIRFPDIQPGSWYEDFAYFARFKQIIEGYPDGTFRGSNLINFAEAAKIIVKTMLGNDVALEKSHTETWYAEYVFQLTSNNAVPVSIRSVDQQITRGEMAEMMYRLKADVFGKPSQTYDALMNGTPETMGVTLYFGNQDIIASSDCAAVLPTTRRIQKTVSVADAALRLLFQGPTAAEKSAGMTASFEMFERPLGDFYQGVTITNGVATVRFTEAALDYLNNAACIQDTVKAPIEQTLLQFPSIKSIQYSIDGEIFTEWDA